MGRTVSKNLSAYQKKRTLDKTPEPSGREAEKPSRHLRFVVQKHQASHLHYDFRLEGDGVLKSWAIPKGPSLNPEDKRLAMMVEDHPLAYRHFEGIIPKGNYGAGTVIVWDEGTYAIEPDKSRAENEKLLLEGIQAGKLTFEMHGEKLSGRFHMVKMKGREENSWLLFKEEDNAATKKDVLKQDASVRSGKNLKEMAEDPEAGEWNSKARRKLEDLLAELDPPKAGIPRDVSPMLTTLVDDPFNRKNWFFEIKWDGYRAIAEVQQQKKKARLYSRNGNDFRKKFVLIAEELDKLNHDVVLDGEVVGLDAAGNPDFNRVKNYSANQDDLFYYIFDCLYLDGYELRGLPLRERKKILKLLMDEVNQYRLRYCDHVENNGEDFFYAVRDKGLEGMIGKNAESTYQTGVRSHDWLKVKTHQAQEAIIVGYTRPRGGRNDIGALILAVHDEKGKLTYIGHTGTGLTADFRKELRAKLDAISRKTCPVKPEPDTNEKATWVSPKLVCEVKFAEWTPDGSLRQPVFVRMRNDKKPATVKRETANDTATEIRVSKKKTKTASETKSPVVVTHPDKVFFPELKITKQEVVSYYESMAGVLLPYLKDRPMVMNRFPNGIHGKSFYQKDNPHELPEWVETAMVYSESNDKDLRYILGQNLETVIYMANLGCIEMNAWNSRVPNLDNPDYVVIDLDPEDISFEAVIETAQAIRELLDELKLSAYCKTSGKTGLHIYMPTGAKYSFEIVRQFALVFVTIIHRRLPKITSLERKPAKRQKRVYLDYLQNTRGQTMAAPYSLRPVEFAGVSAPLHWKEVKKGLSPEAFTIHTIARRLEKQGDIWAPIKKDRIDILKTLEALQNILEE